MNSKKHLLNLAASCKLFFRYCINSSFSLILWATYFYLMMNLFGAPNSYIAPAMLIIAIAALVLREREINSHLKQLKDFSVTTGITSNNLLEMRMENPPFDPHNEGINIKNYFVLAGVINLYLETREGITSYIEIRSDEDGRGSIRAHDNQQTKLYCETKNDPLELPSKFDTDSDCYLDDEGRLIVSGQELNEVISQHFKLQSVIRNTVN